MATKKSELVLTCNATAIKDVMNFLNQKLDELIKKRDALNNKGVQNWTAQDKKDFKQWGDDIAAINSAMQKNREEMVKYGQAMKDLAGTKTKDLKRALGEVKRALDNMSARDPKRAQLEQDLRKIQAQIDRNTVSVKNNTSAWGSLGTTLKNLVAYAGVFAMFNKMKSLFEDFIKLNKEFSDQLANIRKVSGLAMSDINQLATRLAKIDTRSTVQELNELAYAGAKLGFGNLGVDALEGFVKSALKVQNALKEDMGEDSMTALSKLVEVMGLIPKMGVERAMDAAGSAIFKLASTSTATGTNIIEFTKRLMGLANVSHVTTAELLALGSASDSMGLMAEVSSTAFTKMFTSIQSNYTAIEQAVGLTKGTLKDLLDQGRTMDALVEVFDKMHGMSMEEMKARGIFKALGSEGSRMNNVMTTMANKIDMLRQHLLTSNEAFEEANAVAKEYEIQMETAAAYAERASNIWNKAFVNPEGVDVVKDFSKAWYEVSKSLTTNEKFMFSIQISLKGILLLLKGIMSILPELFAMLMSGAAYSFIIRLREGEGLLASITTWFGKLTKAQKAFFKAAGWVGIALTIYEVGKAIYDMTNKVKEATVYMKGFNSTLSDVNKEQYTAVKQLDSYVKAINEAKEGTNQRKAAINNFNKIYKPYLSAMLTEKSTALDVAKAYQEVVRQMKAKIALQAKEKDIEEFVNPRVKREADRLEAFDQSRGNSPYNGQWLKSFVDDAIEKRMPLRQLAEEINQRGYHLSDELFENAWKQRSNDRFKNINGVDLGDKDIMRLVNGRELWMALSYASQAYSTNNAINKVNKKYQPWEKDIAKLQSTEDVIEPYSPTTDTTDKEAKAPEWMVEEKKNAEKATKAVIDSIEEFYRLQEAAANELAANGQLEGKDFEMLIKHIQDRKDQMLLEARRAIVGDKNSWDKIKMELEGDLVKRDSEVSREAIRRIQEAEPAKQGAALQKYDGSDEVFGLDSNAYLNSIRKNAAQNELNIQRRQAAIQQEVDKILLQYEYVEQAQRKFGDKLVTLGLITDGYDKVVRQLADGTEIVANTRDVQALANKTVKMDARQFFGVDEDDALELRNMIDALMHTVDEDGNKIRESFASMFPSLDEWMENPEQYLEQMQVFYKTLIDMDSDYYKALKQNYEQEKREFNERWQSMGWKAQQESENTAFETQDSLRKISGQGESFGQTYGFVDEIADDPEIARIKNRMEWRARELEDLQARNASEELIMEKQNEMLKEAAALAEKVSSEVAERIGKIQTLSEPLNAWGEEVGQMLGEMWQGISRDGKLTFGQMAKNMGIEYAKLTLKMMSENLTKKLQQALFYKTFEAEAMAHQSTLTAIEAAGGSARIAAEGLTNTTLETMQNIHDAVRVSKEARIAAIMAMFGVSEGAAKTIAALGFWGIPLIGVITAVLMGLLSSAQSTANQDTAKASATPKVKLASGMLTYDEGNVKRFIGQDGKVYTATEEAQPRDGLVTHPIATTVQGQPALVAENGPEIVVGRKTTQAIMMNEPELIKYLANYEKYGGRGYRPYDSGNVEQVAAAISPQTSDNNGMTADDARALVAAIGAFNQTVAQMQQKGIPCYINKYGTGGLIEEVKSGMKFMGKYQ